MAGLRSHSRLPFNPTSAIEIPDQLTLDKIAKESLAALNGTSGSPPNEEQESQPAAEAEQTNGTTETPTDKPRRGVVPVKIEVRLPWMPPARRAEFQKVKVEDYRPEELEPRRRRRRRRRESDYDDYPEQFGTRKRKRKRYDNDYESYDEFEEDSIDEDDVQDRRATRRRTGSIDDDLEVGNGRRSTRASTRASSHLASSEGEHGSFAETGGSRRLRARTSVTFKHNLQYDDRDELQDSDGGDPTFAFVHSDIAPKKRRRLRKLSVRPKPPSRTLSSLADDSDIEFESHRRSSRANKATRIIINTYQDDDDEYAEEVRPMAAPKVMSMREVFQPVSIEFKEAHRTVCDSCGYGDDHNKGPLIPCQGCSNCYHKACLGVRSTRDHRVTKVDADSFVMQCRYCICIYKRKDFRAPSHDVCQGCHTKNPSCVPFSEKKTPGQEEALRKENGGVGPITPVDQKLVNNPDNVMFRCGRCRRAWHYEHLPHPNKSRDPAINDPLNLRKHRREEYQITWTCKACQDTEEEKIDKVVAWRPVNPKAYTKGQWITDFDEDDLEYLLKWQDQSYNHCMWMPGAWFFGVAKPSMRQSFIKRTFGEGSEEALDGERQHVDNLLRWTEKEAIHDSWITPDIILDVHLAPRSAEAEKRYRAKSIKDKFEDDLSRIHHVIKIYVKFEGLGYDDAVWDTPPSPDAGPIYDAFCEAYHEYLNGKHFRSESHLKMRERIEEFRQRDFATGIEVKQQPKGLRRGKLMEYQLEGLNWMLYNYRHERSVILADEMGLGKTVQVVALLSSFIQDDPRIWPFLVVVPNATCPNWRREIKKWAPDLRVVAYYGGRVSQSLALQYELFPNGSRDMKAHVVIMSYDSVKDSELRSRFAGVKWAGLVVDEAQALKNDENNLYRALNALRIPFKLLLTGTPLQNNKRELFNLLQFVDPSMKAERLDEQFEQITSENLPELHNLIRPYFLRRTKAEVLTFLPPMAQIIIPVSMSVLQQKLCKSIMERNPQLIRSIFVQSKMKASDRGSLSNILMQLRKCLCHPFIYSQSIEDRNTSPELARRNLIEASSKLMLLEIMLPKLKERGHRVLLFSQFLDQLTILEDFLAGMGLKHERLDGSQSSMEKQKKIDAFNAPDSDIFAMLLSTRAGGVGINLATADTVIILDPDWNPHQDIQALSRCHRIGQRKKVLCFQLMTVDSAEEKILQIGRKKLALDHLLIETMDNEEDAPNDVESVLKHGAAALFGEDVKKDAIVYDSAAVDKLLDRSTVEETKTDENKSAESAFAFARVWANDKGALAEDLAETERTINLSVWDEILQQRAEEARREAERAMETLGRGGRRRGAANYAGPRFQFEEGQDGAAESDHGDHDADFIARSEPESSDGETSAVTGESTPLDANSRKGQGRTSQDSERDAQNNAGKKGRGDARDVKGQKDTTAAVLRPPASQDGGQNPFKAGPGRPRKDKDAGAPGTRQPQQIAPGRARAGAAGQAGAGPGSLNGTPGAAAAGATTAAGAGKPAPGRNPIQVVLPGGKVTWPANGGGGLPPTVQTPIPVPVVPSFRPTSTSAGLPTVPAPVPPSVLPSSAQVQQQQAQVQQQQQQPQQQPKLPIQPCIVCGYMHPETWDCPEMRSEVKLRVAMDRLKKAASAAQQQAAAAGGGNGSMGENRAGSGVMAGLMAEEMMRKWRFFGGKLASLKGGGGNLGGGVSAGVSRMGSGSGL